ncbi:hypothetical protein Ancab_015612 [Ancistrocladus abbreviatus]
MELRRKYHGDNASLGTRIGGCRERFGSDFEAREFAGDTAGDERRKKLVETDALRDEPQEEFVERVELVERDLVGVDNMRVLIWKDWEALDATSIDERERAREIAELVATDNEAGIVTSATTVTEEKPLESHSPDLDPKLEEKNGRTKEPPPPAPVAAVEAEVEQVVKKFQDPRWVNGTWDLKQFEKDGKTDWDVVIDASQALCFSNVEIKAIKQARGYLISLWTSLANTFLEARRRKWLENNPESSSNDDPVVFDTSIIPWWAWIKKFHLPEAVLLNDSGHAAMIGFFMDYLVDSLTGLGVVDQMSNFFCKTLLFDAVMGVLLVRKNEDIGTLKSF